mgnify:CR=1 FL=1
MNGGGFKPPPLFFSNQHPWISIPPKNHPTALSSEYSTLILDANHPLVQYITEHQDGENAEMICEQLYDLAKLQHAPLSADAMTKFVARSNDIMMLLTK